MSDLVVKEQETMLPFQMPTLSEKAQEQLAGIKLEYPQLKIPSAGSLFFEIDEEPVKELTGIIVHHGPRNMYYATDFDGANNPPDCSSFDGITGLRREEGLEGDEYIKCKCSECEFGKFGSDNSGNGGKACKEKHQLYILCGGRVVPFSLLLPVSSTRPLNSYATSIFNQGKFLNEVLTSFTLEKATSKSGIIYSRIVFKKVRDLTSEEIAIAEAAGKSVKGNI
jgi:hypothetical protein